MALNLFPTTTRISWSVFKAPNWATRMQRATSGRELTISDYSIPLYAFTLNWEVLKDKWDVRMGAGKGPAYSPSGVTPFDELRQIWDFFNQQMGSAIPFRYYDPSDNTTRIAAATPASTTFAHGDGDTVTFQMASRILAPVIPNSINSVSVNGTPTGAYSIDFDTGLITFVTPPGPTETVAADFTYYYRVRFNTDGLEAENFAFQFWTMKTLKLISKVY